MRNYTDSRPPFIKLNKKGKPKHIHIPKKLKEKLNDPHEH